VFDRYCHHPRHGTKVTDVGVLLRMKLQPLDDRIFGSLQQRPQARWNSCPQGITGEFHSLRIILEV
jgi:hypothetical protein